MFLSGGQMHNSDFTEFNKYQHCTALLSVSMQILELEILSPRLIS